jgi:hypothetical protein
MSFVKLDAWQKKSKPGSQPFGLFPVRNADALALSIAARQPSIPPHSRKRASKDARREAVNR